MHLGPGEQSYHHSLYLLRDAVVLERGADVLAGGDEVCAFFEGNGEGDVGGALGGGCECSMQGIVDVEEGNGQLEHDLGEMARAPLTASLHGGNSATRGLTIQDGREVVRLALAAQYSVCCSTASLSLRTTAAGSVPEVA